VIRNTVVAVTVLVNVGWPTGVACQIVAQPDKQVLETAPTELRVGQARVRLKTEFYVIADAAPGSNDYGLRGFVDLEITGVELAPMALKADRAWLLQGDSIAAGPLEADEKVFRLDKGPWTRYAYIRGSWPDWVHQAASPDVVVRLVSDTRVLGYVRAPAQNVRAILASGRTPCRGGALAARWAGAGILFEVGQPWGGTYHLEPVAVVHNGQLEEPPSGCDIPGFREAFYQPGHRYEVFSHGRLIGHATVAAADTERACVEARSASVLISADLAKDVNAIAADSGRLVPHPIDVQPLTPGEDSVFASLMTRALVDSGLPLATVRRLKPSSTYALRPSGKGGATLVASARVDSAGDHGLEWSLNTLVMAEQRQAYVPTLVWHSEGDEVETAQARFLDIFSARPDTAPQILVGATYYESWDYWIYRRNGAGSWVRVYRGGGSGC